jgi:hypothetical protein
MFSIVAAVTSERRLPPLAQPKRRRARSRSAEDFATLEGPRQWLSKTVG